MITGYEYRQIGNKYYIFEEDSDSGWKQLDENYSNLLDAEEAVDTHNLSLGGLTKDDVITNYLNGPLPKLYNPKPSNV